MNYSGNVSFFNHLTHLTMSPEGLFWRIHQMDLSASWFIFALITGLSTWLIAYAYKHHKYVLKFKIVSKHGDAISREVTKQIVDDKKMTKKERDERVLWKQNEVADYEATTFTIFYNNAIFLTVVVILSFYVFSSFNSSINYILSVPISGSLCALISRNAK